MQKKPLQWHPGFFAVLQIEFEEERDKLRFENEHQLSKKPLSSDVLIVKKNREETIHKNIGKLFLEHNLIEYKSPEDYVSISDYYKVLAYLGLYISDTIGIDPTQVTMTFVCSRYPRKMIKHLQSHLGCQIESPEPGIYHLMNLTFPTQVIVNKKLKKETNRWLSSLHDQLRETEDLVQLAESFRKHSKDPLYDSAMDLIYRANQDSTKGVKESMCLAIRELYKDELEQSEKVVTRKVTRRVTRKVELESIQKLITTLWELEIPEDIIKQKVMQQYHLSEKKALHYLQQIKKH